MITIQTKIIDPRIGREFPLPSYATEGAAGMDLRACIDNPVIIECGATVQIGTGIAISILDSSQMALLAPRSGLGTKHGIVLANSIGIIDADYQNEIKVSLHNRGKKQYEIRPGERVCQLVIMPITRAVLQVVEEFSTTTDRGGGGFGSTGRF